MEFLRLVMRFHSMLTYYLCICLLTAEAARQRYGQPAPPVETDRESSPPLLYTVPSLLQVAAHL